MTGKEQIPVKDQKRSTWDSYKIAKKMMADPIFRKYIGDYHASPFSWLFRGAGNEI